MLKAAVIGATGYAGYETARLLTGHPEVEITQLGSHSHAGKKFSDIYPNMTGLCDIICSEDSVIPEADVVFTSLPHGISQEIVPNLLEAGRRVIDLSGDFRYKSAATYEKWYGAAHKRPDLLPGAVYGLTELNRVNIAAAGLVANPGCYPTTVILGLAPLMSSDLIDLSSIIADSASGVSGAGRSSEPSYQFCECAENFKAYKIASHRHTSEMEEALSILAGKEIMLSFTPHLVPMKRGMLTTIYANLPVCRETCDIIEIYRKFYSDEFFVRVLDEGKLPETKFTAGTNFLDIGIVVDKRLSRVIVVSSIDNLGKGAAGQAVQNMNVMFGLPERSGLSSPGLYL